jgi:hypothetical protein
MTYVFSLGDRIVALLRETKEPLPARAVWERLGCQGAASSVHVRLSTLRLEGRVYCARPGDSSVDTPTLWRAL